MGHRIYARILLIFHPLGEATSSMQTLDQSLKIIAFQDPKAKLLTWLLKFCLLRERMVTGKMDNLRTFPPVFFSLTPALFHP